MKFIKRKIFLGVRSTLNKVTTTTTTTTTTATATATACFHLCFEEDHLA